MFTILLNIGISLFFFVPGILGIFFGFKRRQMNSRLRALENKNYHPPVSIILPFKGYDYNFENTIKQLLNQQYDGKYEVLFVTSDKDSKAFRTVKELIKNSSMAKLITADKKNISRHRSDKVNNSLFGIKNVSSESEVYLFIDSDIVPHSQWIKHMVKPLQFKECGLSSGSAWVVSRKNDLWGLATRYWDFLATTMITFPVTNFARGFSMGIRREVFERLRIQEIWENAFHDNFSLSTAVKQSKLAIYYAPFCLVSEHFDIGGFEWIKWIKRQALNTKINYKRLWAFGFFLVTLPRLIGAVSFIITTVLSLVFLKIFPFTLSFLLWPLIHLFAATIIINLIYPDRRLYPDYKNTFRKKLKLLIASYVTVIYCYSSVWAIFSNKIEWRNILYHEKTPFTTVTIKEMNVHEDKDK